MQQYIERLLEGKFEYDKGCLEFDRAKIELSLKRGEIKEGSFTIRGEAGHLTQGTVFSSLPGMKVLNPDFLGNGEEIHYQFDARDIEEGEVLKGEFDIISNQGEYYVPFVVSVEYPVLTSSMGPIKNLFHFANLAKSNWTEAVTLFYDAGFLRILDGNDRKYRGLYQGLCVYPGNEQNVEEFLIGIKKKQRIEYLIEKDLVKVENPEQIRRETIQITRNGWGYTYLKAECEGEFVQLEKETLTENDFLGNYCYLDFYIDSAKLHAGKNYTKIRIYNSYCVHEVMVEVYVEQKDRDILLRHQMYSYNLYELMNFYEKFRLRKIGTNVWLTETGKLVEKLEEYGEDAEVIKLFEAQLLITQERFNEAKWILDRIGRQLEGRQVKPEIACYYLYLNSLNSREEAYVDQIAHEVECIFEQYRENWRIAWLMLYLSENYCKSSAKKWLFLEEQFERGCNSPVLYIEAIVLLQQNPALLTKLGAFEQHVLCYGVRKGVLKEDLVRQILSVAGQMKEFRPLVLRILEGCYECRPGNDALQTICSYLIKGNLVSPKYFRWYKLGVESEVRVTRLYEYYMLSMDLADEAEIPRMVMMYFAYQNELTYEKNARLYAHVVKNRDRYPEIYANYREQMERFVLEQIDAGHINRDLAYLYSSILTPQMIHNENAEAFSRLLFMNLFTTEYEKLRQIVVIHAQDAKETAYPLQHGHAAVPIYTSDYTVLFEDDEHNRFCGSVNYNIEKLMIPGKFAKFVAPFVRESTGFAVYMCESSRSFLAPNEDNLIFYQKVVTDEALDADYRAQICQRLLGFLYETDRMRELDQVLDGLDMTRLHARDRAQALQYLILRGNFDKAYEWVCRFGPECVDSKSLMRLCSRLLERENFTPTPEMTQLCMVALEHGKVDKQILEYLMVQYQGLAKKLRDIWKKGRERELDCHALEHRLLEQVLYTGAYVGERQELFTDYVSGDYDPMLREAFVIQSSYDYFVKEKVMPAFLFEQIEQIFRENGMVQKVCKLAFVKYFAAEGKEQATLHAETLKEFVGELVGEGKLLPLYREYQDLIPAVRHFYDRTIIEYRAHPGSRVHIHYLVEKDSEQEAEYITEEMTDVFEGVCSKEFVLFFGETLQYYIIEERDGEEQLTESATIRKNDIGKEILESRFSRINDLVISQTLEDYSTLDTMLEEYYQADYYADYLFRLL